MRKYHILIAALVVLLDRLSKWLVAQKITLHDSVDNEDYAAQAQATVAYLVVPTTTTLTSSLNPAPAGNNVTFTATVTASGSGFAPTGTVNFADFGTPLGPPVALNPGGVATFSISTLAAGPHSIVATYAGDNRHTGSPSNSVPQIVTTVGQGPSTTTLSVTSTRITGRLRPTKATLTATVTAGATGTVSFYDGERFVGMASLVNGHATIGTTQLTIGANSLRAAYSGDGSFAASFSPVVVAYRSPKPR